MAGLGEDTSPLAQVVLGQYYPDFGFNVFRADYDDDDAWIKWHTAVTGLIDEEVVKQIGGERLDGKAVFALVDHDDLKGAMIVEMLQ